ncbi:MAG: hypothetical protein MOGMAGMI_00360 [Candidatus Omnitrophica bacterium]|nr:hypothetical protein [Candidatus Omnitrophota bacterium]
MITKISAKNFLSWSEIDFEIPEGVTLIDGWNFDDNTPEGSGKSSILNAVSWAFFGKIPKSDVGIDDVVKLGEKSCLVQIHFDGTSKYSSLIRTRKPNEVYLIDHENKVIKGSTASDTQKIIDNFLQISFETFCQTVYFAQNYPKKFMTASQEDRFKILSEIENLQLFDKAYKRTHEILKNEEDLERKLLSNINLVVNDISHKNQLLITTKNFLVSKQESNQKAILEIQEELVDLQSKSTLLSQEIENYPDFEEALGELEVIRKSTQENFNKINEEVIKAKISENSLESDFKALQRELHLLEEQRNNIGNNINQLKSLTQAKHEKCPTCEQELHQELKFENEKEDISRLESVLTQLYFKIESTKSAIESIYSIKAKSEKGTSKLSNLQIEVKKNQEYLEEISGDILKLREDKTKKESSKRELHNIKQNIEKLSNKLEFHEKNQDFNKDLENIKELEAKIVEKTQDLEELKKVHSIMSDKVTKLNLVKNSFKKAKVYAYDTLLNDLNSKSNNYLKELFETPIKIRFHNSDNKVEVTILHEGAEKGYGLLSGGESTRVSLAVDLALSEILQNRGANKFNIRFLDEYFRFLSEESMQRCLNLLSTLKGNTLIIEHNSLFKSIVDRTVLIEKREGKSTLKDKI